MSGCSPRAYKALSGEWGMQKGSKSSNSDCTLRQTFRMMKSKDCFQKAVVNPTRLRLNNGWAALLCVGVKMLG